MTSLEERVAEQSELEFVLLIAFLMSLVALAIDMMLPALPIMGVDLGTTSQNQTQLVISVLFLGLTFAQLIYGPLSDQIGRKPTIAAGLLIFLAGSVVCVLATNFDWMLLGRLIQGIGVAGLRVIVVASVRDHYEEEPMARIMSLAISVFIMVPCFAPILGQGILAILHWRWIFVAFIILASTLLLWFWLRMPETLPRSARIPFNVSTFIGGMKQTLTNRVAMGFTVANGFITGAFMGYLISSAQIFYDIYDVGHLFGLYFGMLAASIGVASVLNAKLVFRFGTRRLAVVSIVAILILGTLFLGITWILEAAPPLWLFLSLMVSTFFFVGFCFGNLNAIAMQPVGHIAGVAASTMGLIAGAIALAIASTIGWQFNGTVLPLAVGFTVCSFAALVIVRWTLPESQRPTRHYPSTQAPF